MPSLCNECARDEPLDALSPSVRGQNLARQGVGQAQVDEGPRSMEGHRVLRELKGMERWPMLKAEHARCKQRTRDAVQDGHNESNKMATERTEHDIDLSLVVRFGTVARSPDSASGHRGRGI